VLDVDVEEAERFELLGSVGEPINPQGLAAA
jgi:hypothetical protein